jgi:acyl-CoA reductase-like NAD-dependent aldehyde dehydrogenase
LKQKRITDLLHTCSVYNPADGSLVAGDIQIAGPEDVDAAVDAAEKAFPAWKKTHPEVRKALMLKLADLIDQNSEALLALTTLTLGSPSRLPGLCRCLQPSCGILLGGSIKSMVNLGQLMMAM